MQIKKYYITYIKNLEVGKAQNEQRRHVRARRQVPPRDPGPPRHRDLRQRGRPHLQRLPRGVEGETGEADPDLDHADQHGDAVRGQLREDQQGQDRQPHHLLLRRVPHPLPQEPALQRGRLAGTHAQILVP